ncbi:hypothetical protein C7H19_20445 [Aphanothece hegewaldii CCALA 016]|uniref:Uncharacterized protein n=1 Tax=Aphanothece hegewaldii CCALA 016 TaxID=2107694 RepID=A0A2T1LSV0_9CHRO|nr:hypothetical protein [Aphanothece hegewaldii]PSF33177.1 hypothetical protein C7H19_20445 [Aphanothece hegewaldii CCALA 016]
MTANVFDRTTAGFLILILPLAIVIMILFTAWKWILLFMGLSLALKIWQNYQWTKWSRTIDPVFHQLVTENQGCLTPMDLSQKANLSGWTAKEFLERKAEEFGAQRKKIDDEGVVYYFLTANALGSIFADSDPVEEEEDEIIETKSSPVISPEASVMNISKILDFEEELEEDETPSNFTLTEEDDEDESDLIDSSDDSLLSESSDQLSLIQSELAKRLDTNSSTVGRRKSEPDFAQWSQSRDPEGIAWKYVRRTRTFVPTNIENNS